MNETTRIENAKLREMKAKTLVPATKFLGNTLNEQWRHVLSENKEELQAYGDYKKDLTPENKKALGMELIDGQSTRETLLNILFTREEIIELHLAVKEKNAVRGYYEIQK